MYVRWKLRTCKQWVAWEKADVTYSAYLVENKRVEGKPQQKVLAFLGSIRKGADGRFHFYNSLFHDRAARYQFLSWLDARLSRLDLTAEQRQRMVAQVHKVVPPLTPEERVLYEAEEAEERASTSTLLQAVRSGYQL